VIKALKKRTKKNQEVKKRQFRIKEKLSKLSKRQKKAPKPEKRIKKLIVPMHK
jgi:hypothetical protein